MWASWSAGSHGARRPGGWSPHPDDLAGDRSGGVGAEPEHHVGHYGPSSLARLLTQARFELLGMETFPALGYVRPGRALRPPSIAVQALELAQVRAAPRRPHPVKHELLRAFARQGPGPGSGR